MKLKKLHTLIVLIMFSGCTPGIMKCFLEFDKHQTNYKFNYSKEQLKHKIVESYSYNESLFLKNFGKTIIENEQVNKKYRTSTDNWLDKRNWDKFKAKIRKETSDTLNLIIGKYHYRKAIEFKVIISGNDKKSELTIEEVSYKKRKACEKEINFYRDKIQGKIEKKFIRKIK